jgi:hypothetical protein
LGTTAPVESVTVPVIVPNVAWPRQRKGRRSRIPSVRITYPHKLIPV